MPQPEIRPQNSPMSIFVSAGDPSGDIAGYHLLKAMSEVNNRCQYFGLGGRRMRSLEQEQLVESDKLAVLGFWEVAQKFIFFRNLLSETVRQIEQRRPTAIILIDYPGFNLRLAERIKHLKIPIIYYISPQIWAWGGKRIKLIKSVVDLMLVILPFEKELYDRAGVRNQFVGHYLLDDVENRFIKAPYNPDSDLIALLPGSRPQEIEKMLPVLIDAARILTRDKKYRFAVAGIEGKFDYGQFLKKSSVDIELRLSRTRELVAESRLVITSSGTATLETGIIGRPMIVIYKTGMLTYLIARRLVKLDKIALVNITAGKKLAPELIQSDATSFNIAAEARKILSNQTLARDIVTELHHLTDRLGSPGVGKRAASFIGEFLQC
jgi:lipid-A-disaccharide synthase